MVNIQYQLSNGMWTNCENRADEFLKSAATFQGWGLQDVRYLLNKGKEVRHGPGWHDFIRCSLIAKMQSELLEKEMELRYNSQQNEEDFDKRFDEQ